MKINFGAGKTKKKGYKNCDIRALKEVDFICSAWDITQYIGEKEVDECFARHFLEHLTPNKARLTLKAWRQVLKDGGKIDIEVPDIAYHAMQLITAPTEQSPIGKDSTNYEHAIAGFYGWQTNVETGEDWDIHKWGYTEKTLKLLLTELGFKNLERVESEPWNLRIVGNK